MAKSKYPVISQGEFDTLFNEIKNWNKWGKDDEKGTLNYITPDKIIAAAALVKSGRSVSMSIPMDKVAGPDNPMPVIPPRFLLLRQFRRPRPHGNGNRKPRALQHGERMERVYRTAGHPFASHFPTAVGYAGMAA